MTKVVYPPDAELEKMILDGKYWPFERWFQSCNLKYTSHLIGVAVELLSEQRFRHVDAGEMVKAIDNWGSCRKASWGSYPQEIYSEYEYEETRKGVAITVGLSCLACDDLIFAGAGDKWEPRWHIIDKIIEPMAQDQCDICISLIGPVKYENRLPCFCEPCFSHARKIPKDSFLSWRLDEVQTLKRLLAIFEGMNPCLNSPLTKTAFPTARYAETKPAASLITTPGRSLTRSRATIAAIT